MICDSWTTLSDSESELTLGDLLPRLEPGQVTAAQRGGGRLCPSLSDTFPLSDVF
jgi:hypothetical protein